MGFKKRRAPLSWGDKERARLKKVARRRTKRRTREEWVKVEPKVELRPTVLDDAPR